MKKFEKYLLPLVGVGVFLGAWSAVVELTRPAARARVTLGFSSPADGRTWMVVVGEKRTSVKSEELNISDADDAVAKLRTAMGEYQPTLAAVSDETGPASPLGKIIEKARDEFGGGLDVAKIPAPGTAPGVPEATKRAFDYQEKRLVRPGWLPTPLESITALGEMGRTRWEILGDTWNFIKQGEFFEAQLTLLKFNEIIGHSFASILRILVGFLLAALVGIPTGLAIGTFIRLNAALNSLVQMLRPISPIAWLPVATFIFSGAGTGAIFIVFLASVFPIIISVSAAVGTLDQKYRRSAVNFGIQGLEFARCVLVPATMPSILVALRVAIGIAWLVVVAAEMLGVEQGLGYLVHDARNQLRLDRVVAAMIIIGTIGLLIDYIFRTFERRILERRGLGAR